MATQFGECENFRQTLLWKGILSKRNLGSIARSLTEWGMVDWFHGIWHWIRFKQYWTIPIRYSHNVHWSLVKLKMRTTVKDACIKIGSLQPAIHILTTTQKSATKGSSFGYFSTYCVHLQRKLTLSTVKVWCSLLGVCVWENKKNFLGATTGVCTLEFNI